MFEKARPERNVAPFLNGVSKGQNVDVRTPLWEKAPREDIISRWDDILESQAHELPGRLYEIETEQREKIGPSSIRAPWSERASDLELYYTEWSQSVPDDLYLFADNFSAQLRSRVNLGNLRSTEFSTAMQSLPRNTNSGLPYFTRRSTVEQEDLQLAISGGWNELGCVVGWRGQAAGLNQLPKQRIVWMYPQSANIVEASFFRPLHDILVVHPSFSAWTTPRGVDLAVRELLLAARSTNTAILSSDFSGFDQHLGPPLTDVGFEIIKMFFQHTEFELLDEVREYFQNCKMLTPNGYREGEHGVPSGSTFTNMMDSILHILMQYSVANRCGHSRHPSSQVQGDDGLLLLEDFDDPVECLPYFEEYGMVMNADKQFVGSNDCLYLQRYHHVDWEAGGIYPTYRALSSLMGQERMHNTDEWDEKYVSLRSIMILENTKNHPLFLRFVKFVADADKFGLGSKWPGGIEVFLDSQTLRGAAEIPGFVPSYNQEDKISGIFTFDTVKVLKEL